MVGSGIVGGIGVGLLFAAHMRTNWKLGGGIFFDVVTVPRSYVNRGDTINVGVLVAARLK